MDFPGSWDSARRCDKSVLYKFKGLKSVGICIIEQHASEENTERVRYDTTNDHSLVSKLDLSCRSQN
jgi:hypothetical protein